tara:strand:- start:111 stop:233 length:123 start_codon:yes stop_codon:yes gene_type:complete
MNDDIIKVVAKVKAIETNNMYPLVLKLVFIKKTPGLKQIY